MTDTNPVPSCLSHLTQRDAAVRARALEQAYEIACRVVDQHQHADVLELQDDILGALKDAITTPPAAAPAPDEAQVAMKARMTAAIEARAVARGRHLTAEEQLSNLANALQKDEDDEAAIRAELQKTIEIQHILLGRRERVIDRKNNELTKATATIANLVMALRSLIAATVNPYDGGEYEHGEVPALDFANAALEDAIALVPRERVVEVPKSDMKVPFTSAIFNKADAARNAALRIDINDHISALGDAFNVVREETLKEAGNAIAQCIRGGQLPMSQLDQGIDEAWRAVRSLLLQPPAVAPAPDESAIRAELVAALREIAKQRTQSEMDWEEDYEADFESAYDEMITVARAALARADATPGGST